MAYGNVRYSRYSTGLSGDASSGKASGAFPVFRKHRWNSGISYGVWRVFRSGTRWGTGIRENFRWKLLSGDRKNPEGWASYAFHEEKPSGKMSWCRNCCRKGTDWGDFRLYCEIKQYFCRWRTGCLCTTKIFFFRYFLWWICGRTAGYSGRTVCDHWKCQGRVWLGHFGRCAWLLSFYFGSENSFIWET